MMMGWPEGKELTLKFQEVAKSSDGVLGERRSLKPVDENEPSILFVQESAPPENSADPQLDFEEFLKVVKKLDPDEERRVARELGLTEVDRDAAKICFRTADKEKTGLLNLEKACAALHALHLGRGTNASAEAVLTQVDYEDLFVVADSDGSGDLDFLDFLRFFGKTEKLRHQREETEAAKRLQESVVDFPAEEVERFRAYFEKYDKSGDGSLQKDEIGLIFKDLGIAPRTMEEREEYKRILDEIDVNGDGDVDFDEFLRLIKA